MNETPSLVHLRVWGDFEWVDDFGALPVCDWNEDLGLMLYDVFDHHQREQGFRWLRTDERAETATPAIAKSRSRRPVPQDWKGLKIQPEAAFFHARVAGGVMDCNPSRVSILTSQTGGQSPCS